MAMANIFGGGMGWELSSTDDPLVAQYVSIVTEAGEKIINDLITDFARAIRHEIVDAWNKGQG